MKGQWIFKVTVNVAPPVLVGRDAKNGRRQLIPIVSGTVAGDGFDGEVMPGGVDSQVVRPNGVCELSARYGIRLSNGSTIYIQNDGIRTVPDEYVETVLNGEFVDPSLYYFCTTPKVEVFGGPMEWMEKKILYCEAKRNPDSVEIDFFSLES